MSAWRHGWPVAAVCLVVLCLVSLRLAALASQSGAATREAQLSTYGATDAVDLSRPMAPAAP